MEEEAITISEIPEIKEGPVDLQSILEQHRKVYNIPTDIGTIKLKYLPKARAQQKFVRLCLTDPGYKDILSKLEYLRDVKALQALSPEMEQEFREVLAFCAKYADEYATLCFVSPEVKTVEELEHLFQALPEDQMWMVKNFLLILTAPVKIDEIDASVLRLCKEYGIPASDDLTAETLTANQCQVLEKGLATEAQEIKDAMNQDGDGF